jgi:GNAT superfamily N-acetyltransferase
VVIDLVRDLAPVRGLRRMPGLVVRRADPDDDAAIVDLDLGLRRHLAASPIFLRMGPASPPELHRRAVADPAQATFLAEAGGRAIAMLRIGPSSMDVATIVRDPGTASISSAFTVEDRRGDGVATHLLDAALGWAREGGYQRVAVDHESANGEAFRFWGRHFTPVAVSLARRLPARVAP